MKPGFLLCVLACGAARAATIALVAEGGDLAVPFGVAFDKAGNLYAPEVTQNRIWRLDTQGKTSVVVGTGKAGYAGDDGPAHLAQINWEHNCIVAGDIL